MWSTVLLVVHLMIAVALVAVVLLQKSEGGALGIGGGGGGGGGFLTGRGSADLLTRTTSILAVVFFMTSLGLTILANQASTPSSVFDRVQTPAPATTDSSTPATPATSPPAEAPRGGVLDALEQGRGQERLPKQ